MKKGLNLILNSHSKVNRCACEGVTLKAGQAIEKKGVIHGAMMCYPKGAA